MKTIGWAAPAFIAGAPFVQASRLDGLRLSDDLEFMGSRVKLMRRSEWCEVAPRPWLLRTSLGYDRLTVHHAGAENLHTARNAVICDLDGVLTSHRDRNYGDIGYHFIVDYGGRVWEGRSLAYEGAHVSQENAGNIGIMALGNFEAQSPSSAQLKALGETVACLRQRFGIASGRVYGHRDLGRSLCPGRYLYSHIVKLRA